MFGPKWIALRLSKPPSRITIGTFTNLPNIRMEACKWRKQWFLGIDWQWKQTTICIVDHNGRGMHLVTFRSGWCKVLQWPKEIKRPFAVCFEARQACS